MKICALKRIVSLLLSAILIFMVSGCIDNKKVSKPTVEDKKSTYMTEYDTDYVKLRKGLNNAYIKLNSENEFTIAYLGGSITAGAGAEKLEVNSWRALTTAWFKETFKGVEFTEINIGIGSTGSLLPSFYVDQYVNPKKPDLVFLEMAVNDYLDGSTATETSIQYETVVRKILLENPECEIISVYTINDVLSANEEYFTQAAAQNEIAAHYGIPSANVGRKLRKEKGLINPKINGEYTQKWKAFFGDEVHPTTYGHKEYANTIVYLLESAFKLVDKQGGETEKSELPAPKNEKLNTDTQFILATDLDLKNSKGWQIAVNNSPSGLGIAETICTETSENELNFTFEGENLYFYSSIIPFNDDGKLFKVSIDGGEWEQVGPSGAHPIVVAENLKNGKHTVKFVAGGVGNGTINRYDLTAVLVK